MGTHEITQRPDAIDVSGTFETEAELDDFVRRLYCAAEGVWPSAAPEQTEEEPRQEPSSMTVAPPAKGDPFASVSHRQQRVLDLLQDD